MNRQFTIPVSLLLLILLVLSLVTNTRAGSFMPPPGGGMSGLGGMPGSMPGAMPQMAPGQMPFPQGGMPDGAPGGPGQMPTEAEMQAAAEWMEGLSKSDKQEDKDLLKAIEVASQQLTASMSDNDIKELSKAMNIDPKELMQAREEAKEYMSKVEQQPAEAIATPTQEEGLEPDEGPAEHEEGGEPSEEPGPKKASLPEEQKASKITKVTSADRKQAELIVNSLIEHLESLSQKGASLTFIDTELRAWRQVLRDFIYDLYLINTPERLEALFDFKDGIIIKHLKELLTAFASEEEKLTVPEITEIESPYKVLGISPKSTDKEVTAAYKKLKKKLNPTTLKKELTNDKVIEEDIKRAMKLNKFALNAIEEAYTQLKDKASRAQLDRGLDAKTAEFNEIMGMNKVALNSIKLALDSSVFKNQLLPNFEELLSKIAPKELAQRKAMEDSEKKQIKEQEKRARKASTKSSQGGQLEPSLSYHGSSSDGYSGSGYYPDYGPGRYYPGMQGYDPYGGKSGSEGQAKPSEKKEPAASTTTPPPSNMSAEAQKIDPRSIEEMIRGLENNLSTMRVSLKKASTQTLRAALEAEPKKVKDLEKIDVKIEKALTEKFNDFIRDSGWNTLNQDLQKLVSKMTLLSTQKRTPQEFGAWSSFKNALTAVSENKKQDFKEAESLEEMARETPGSIFEEFGEAFIAPGSINKKHLFTEKERALPIRKQQAKLERDIKMIGSNVDKIDELFVNSGLESKEEEKTKKTQKKS
ncbi:TPA: hypothetical protein DEG75_04600 [Candidatus Dependentiae bacterium]|nr:hypothetical protein [Candidatus Dependentiae bacterium]